MKHSYLAPILGLLCIGCNSSRPISLGPDPPSSAPDYFCTWNIQGYIASYPNTSDAMRAEMIEENIFGKGQYQDWIDFFPALVSS